MKGVCATCKHFAAPPAVMAGDAPKGQCFRYPPVMGAIVMPHPMTHQPQVANWQGRPGVGGSDTCGEWASGGLVM